MSDSKWKFVVEFSCIVEDLKKFDEKNILACHYHPSVPGDALVVMVVPEAEILALPFKTYSNNREYTECRNGGLKVWKVTDVESFRGLNDLDVIRAEYNV